MGAALEYVMTDSPWLTLNEAAEYSKYSESHLRHLISVGRLRGGGRTRSIRIHRDHLDIQIESGFPVLGVQGPVESGKVRRRNAEPQPSQGMNVVLRR